MDFQNVKQNLEAHGFKVSCFDSAKDAVEYLDAAIDQTTVGFGGSVTLGEIGLYERLSTHNEVIWHNRLSAGEDVKEARRKANAAKIYISSVNALAQTGEIINIDGAGNRVASTFYGHEKLYFVVGENKITPDYDSALYRARNVASPLNAKRLGVKTPCAEKADRCYDCKSPERICRGLSVLWGNMMGADTEVILIHETLGY